VFHVDKCHGAAQFLSFGRHVQAQGGLAGRFRTEDLGDASSGNAADAQGNVEREGASGNGFHLQGMSFPQAHDGAFAVALDDITQGFVEHSSPGFIHRIRTVQIVKSALGWGGRLFCHEDSPRTIGC